MGSPTKKLPGESIRKLGNDRHQSAMRRYALAVGFFIGAVLLFSTFGRGISNLLLPI